MQGLFCAGEHIPGTRHTTTSSFPFGGLGGITGFAVRGGGAVAGAAVCSCRCVVGRGSRGLRRVIVAMCLDSGTFILLCVPKHLREQASLGAPAPVACQLERVAIALVYRGAAEVMRVGTLDASSWDKRDSKNNIVRVVLDVDRYKGSVAGEVVVRA